VKPSPQCHLRDCVGAVCRLREVSVAFPRGAAAMPLALQLLRAADQSEGWLAPTLALLISPRFQTMTQNRALPSKGIGDVIGLRTDQGVEPRLRATVSTTSRSPLCPRGSSSADYLSPQWVPCLLMQRACS
jgi:hypothetical protein